MITYFDYISHASAMPEGEIWDTVRNALSATMYPLTENRSLRIAYYWGQVGGWSAKVYNIGRGFSSFNTSRLQTANPFSARFLFNASAEVSNSTIIPIFHLVQGHQHEPPIDADYSSILASLVSGGQVDLTAISGPKDPPYAIQLNAAGLDWINPLGMTYFGMRAENDLLNLVFTGVTIGYGVALRFYPAYFANTTDEAYPADTSATLVGTFKGLSNPMLEVQYDGEVLNYPRCYFKYWLDDGLNPTLSPVMTSGYALGALLDDVIRIPVSGLAPNIRYGYQFCVQTEHFVYTGAIKYFTTTGTPPPPTLEASFTASPATGKPPLTVNFQDTSVGDIAGRLWDFGDGETSGEVNPTHVYGAVGNYLVTLTVTDTLGNQSAAQFNVVVVAVVKSSFPWWLLVVAAVVGIVASRANKGKSEVVKSTPKRKS